LIVGSGPIGCELGQAFQRLGTQVYAIERADKFLPREDSDAAHLLQEQLIKDGVKIHLSANPTKFEVIGESSENGFP
jgi:pyruvate/2-oxoglutarate dehydrogenase complex dihydrolipoamide dehydrogenase (E3) component